MSKEATLLHGIAPKDLIAEFKEIKREIRELSDRFIPKEPNVWITRKEASELLGVSLVTIHNWTKEEIINAYKIGNRVKFRRSELEEILLNSNKKASE